MPSIMKKAKFHLGICLLACSVVVSAAPVVVTPGSMAGYTYFSAPNAGSGSGTGGAGGENSSTLMRCVKTPSVSDKTINLSTRNWYDMDKPVSIYYKMWGGDGGGGINGGGGGSSAILKNGTPVAIAPGADGGKTAQVVSGVFTAAKTDTLRFIVAGGGGQALNSYVGGGGGAGYKGGGGGVSIISGTPTAMVPEMGGKGGGSSPGAGGVVPAVNAGSSQSRPGSAGNDMNGGVATYPDGSTAPTGPGASNGTYTASASWWEYGGYSLSASSRYPATPSISGSFVVYQLSEYGVSGSGGGGALGYAGRMAMTSGSTNYGSGREARMWTANDSQWYTNQQSATRLGWAANAVPPTDSFSVPRGQAGIPIWNGWEYYYSPPAGSLPGHIAIMYQAPTCELIPNYSEN